ncbi:hypothetical protein [Corynebacterium phoceense]|uniref:hypothetical protein n=1 Tax=Corynebacterium phoceense TaxID=1686286 RepID=UPI00215C73BC|nr:hypothetical protein [Corynebacterium phoceense]
MVRFLQPLLRGATALVCACALSACAANPGPPPVVDEEEAATVTGTPTTTRAATDVPERTTVSIGVDPLVGGLNPHLAANNQELVQQLTDLVLPSAFRNGVMDTDLLDSAEEVEAPRVLRSACGTRFPPPRSGQTARPFPRQTSATCGTAW